MLTRRTPSVTGGSPPIDGAVELGCGEAFEHPARARVDVAQVAHKGVGPIGTNACDVGGVVAVAHVISIGAEPSAGRSLVVQIWLVSSSSATWWSRTRAMCHTSTRWCSRRTGGW